jgi:tetratricopeptide (TPR) repeat protein
MDWWTQNKDLITSISIVFGIAITILGAIWAVIKWGVLRRWQKKLRVDVKVFEVITDPAVLLPKLYATENDNSPLADHNVKYQPRDPNRDIQAELKVALNRSRYLLITAPTGYGKTREAGMLAQTMMVEGWRVLLIKNTGWLDIPKTLPTELNNNRSRVLIFLDDLNGLFSTGERTESPRAEQIPMLSEPSYHDRLLQALDMLEGMCTKKEIRVIATARSEADQWKLLGFNSKDRLWRRFERVELPEPTSTTIVNLLHDSAKQVDLRANPDDFAAIAHKSDGTYRNILLNLRRWLTQGKDVNKDDFTETLEGSWRVIYENAVRKHPAVKYIYDAIDLLQKTDIWLESFIVEPTALMIWGGNSLQRLVRRAQIRLALNYLTEETKILRRAKGDFDEFNPGDGQIEAKELNIDWSKYIFELERLILDLKNPPVRDPNLLVSYLLFRLGLKCLITERNDQAIKIWQKIPADNLYIWFEKMLLTPFALFPGWANILRHAVVQDDKSYLSYFFAGVFLEMFDRAAEAEDIYRQIVAKNPHDVYAITQLGDVLRELERYAEAEASYRQAIAFDPNYAHAYSRLGSLLRKLERYDESEDAYLKAIDRDPNDAFTYFRFGTLLKLLKRYPEAEKIYHKALEKGLNRGHLPELYFSLASILRKQGHFDEAIVAYKKRIELESSDLRINETLVQLVRLEANDDLEEQLQFLEKLIEVNADSFIVYLAICSINKQLGKPVSTSYIEKAYQLIPENDMYNRACLEGICDNLDFAFEYLQMAKQNEKLNSSWAWKDPDLQWIRSDPRFIEIVGPNPENKNSKD